MSFALRQPLIGFLCVYLFAVFVEAKKESFPVAFDGEAVFYLSHDIKGKPAFERAKDAAKLLSHAIESKDTGESFDSLVRIEKKVDHINLVVKGNFITGLFLEDALAQGFLSLQEYAESTQSHIKTLIAEEAKRQKWQSWALKLFFSVFLIFLGLYFLRQINIWFDKLDSWLVKKRVSLSSVSILGTPILRNESVAGILVFSSAILRWVSYIASAVVFLISILSQFKISQQYLKFLGKSALEEVIMALQAVTASIPGLLLCGLLLLGLHISIYALGIVFDGIKKQRISIKSVPIHRVPVFRTAVPAILCAIILPLAVGAFFHSFHTPTVWMIVATFIVAMMGAIPIFAVWIAGIVVLWRQDIKEGDWVVVAGQKGEIFSISTMFLTIVPPEGGVAFIPMIKLFFCPLQKLAKAPTEELFVDIVCESSMDEKIQFLQSQISLKIEDVSIVPVSLDEGAVRLKIALPMTHHGAKENILFEIMRLASEQKLKLVKKA